MKLYIKQKVFSWRDRFYICDETGYERYYVEGEMLTLGKKLHIYESGGREAAFINEKVFSWLPRYLVEIEGREVCEVVKEIAFFRQSYRLDGLPLRLDGDFFAHEYALYDDVGEVMRMSKKWFSWGDSYELDIYNDANALLCLCVALAVDCALEKQSD